MNTELNLQAETRSNLGTSSSRRYRAKGFVPVVIYGGNKKNTYLLVSQKDLQLLMNKKGIMSSIFNLSIDGKKPVKALFKHHQKHIIKPKTIHVDLQFVSSKTKIIVDIPLEFINQEGNTAIKAGAVFSVNKSTIQVSCLSSKLPEKITVDIKDLKADQVMHESDLILPKGVELTSDADNPIAVINKAKVSAGSVEKGDDS